MRNIDYIRTLKSKQLANFMAHQICDGCDCCIYQAEKGVCKFNTDVLTDKMCNKGTKKWLKQEHDPQDRVWEVIMGRTT